MRKGPDGKKEKTDENCGHYVIASSRPPNADRAKKLISESCLERPKTKPFQTPSAILDF